MFWMSSMFVPFCSRLDVLLGHVICEYIWRIGLILAASDKSSPSSRQRTCSFQHAVPWAPAKIAERALSVSPSIPGVRNRWSFSRVVAPRDAVNQPDKSWTNSPDSSHVAGRPDWAWYQIWSRLRDAGRATAQWPAASHYCSRRLGHCRPPPENWRDAREPHKTAGDSREPLRTGGAPDWLRRRAGSHLTLAGISAQNDTALRGHLATRAELNCRHIG